jgi:transposase
LENMALLFVPAYSPELNPVENTCSHLWWLLIQEPHVPRPRCRRRSIDGRACVFGQYARTG